MRHNLVCLLLSVWIIFGCEQSSGINKNGYRWPENVSHPTAEKLPKELELNGDKRIDEYYWLNERNNPKVLNYLKAENAYTDTMLAGTRSLQKKLFDEMKGRIKEKDESLPYKDNGYWYYYRYDEGKQYPVYCRKKETLDAQEEVLLNQNEMAERFAGLYR